MKFAIAAEHRQYFHQHQLLELEELLTASQADQLVKAIDTSVLKRNDTASIKYLSLPAEQLFMSGRDIWRDDPFIAKMVCNLEFAEIAAELTRSRILRLGYDQWFPATQLKSTSKVKNNSYDLLLSKTDSLRNVSCLQGIVCGLMLCLSDYEGPKDETYEGAFSMNKGSGVFINLERGIDFPTLRKRSEQQFLLIVYADKTALYKKQDGDPNGHDLKRRGYVFGDRLNDVLHPIIYR